MVTKHTHTRLFTISFHLNLLVCVYVWEGEREARIFLLESQHSRFLLCRSLCSHTDLFIFPSYPKHRNAPCGCDLACRPDVCTNRPPWTPCSLWIFLFPSLSLASPSLPQLSHASLSSSARAQEKAPRLQGGSVKRPAPSVTSSAVVLCHSAWGLPLKPKAALEDASDGFCPLFHSPTFIPLRRGRHQGRFLTSMLFRQWCHCHGDVVLCLRPCINGEEKHRI